MPTPVLREWILETIATASGLTGGFISPSRPESRTIAVGTILTKEEFLQDGAIVIGEARGGGYSMPFPGLDRAETLTSQGLVLAAGGSGGPSKWQVSHAIAASLGYSHGTPGRDICARLLANRELTVSCPGHGVTQPTPFDVLHGAVLYGRGAGTRHPDRDQYPLSE